MFVCIVRLKLIIIIVMHNIVSYIAKHFFVRESSESLSCTTHPNLGEAIPVPAQACLCIYAKGRAILGAPVLRTGVGRLKAF